jgi:SAM-dependent methyltransferase
VAAERFTEQSLLEIITHLRAQLAAGATEVRLRVLDPDHGRGRYAGEIVELDGQRHVVRPLRVWVELADRLHLRLSTPRIVEPPWIELRFAPLDEATAWRSGKVDDPREKYGRESGYARISKLDDPGLLLDLADALDRVHLPEAPRILDLGCNRGDELELLLALRPAARLVGIDHSTSAIAGARERFAGRSDVELVCADINELASLELGPDRFDLVIALCTLHSPGVDDRAVLQELVKHRLTPTGGLILGVPNCTHIDGEQLFGARTKNFRQSELSLLVRTVAYYKRWLQQHRRKVYVTGKHYVLVTGGCE